jgi:cytochrome P450
MQRLTKKDLALSLHSAGRTVEEIARALETHPSYVANVLASAGKTPDYNDLYVSSTAQNGYAKAFQGVLRFRDVASARESVERIDALYRAYVEERDRRGQHQAQLTALIGKNRAEGIGKLAEAQVFAEWLKTHLTVEEPDSMAGLVPPPAPDEAAGTLELAFAS